MKASITYSEFLRQRHVAYALGFHVLDFVDVRGEPGKEPEGPGVVYIVHKVSKTLEVALAANNGRKGTAVPMGNVSRFVGKLPANMINTLRSVQKLRKQLGHWASPIMGRDD